MSARGTRRFALAAALAAALALAACGGGGGGGSPPPPPAPPPGPSITTQTLPAALTGQPYTAQLQASGGTPPYTWSIVTGALPSGLAFNNAGMIQGTPTSKGNFNITFQVRDSAFRSAALTLALGVSSGLAVATTALPKGTWFKAYNFVVQASGGVPPYQWSLASGSAPLPASLALELGGVIDGTPSVAGMFNVTLQVQDSLNDTSTRALSLEIANSLVVKSGVLPFVIGGQPYSVSLEAVGGTPPYTWDVAPNSFPLPSGLSLSASGVLSGTTNVVGQLTITVQVRDAAGAMDTSGVFLRLAAPIAISTTSLPDGNVGIQYFQQLIGTGGFFSIGFSWQLASGSGPIPPGLTLRPDGLILGTPTTPGLFPIKVELRDVSGQLATQDVSILIKNDLIVTTTGLALGVVNQVYQDTLKAVGGTLPYRWSVSSGALPPGLSLDPNTGVVSGTPTQAGTFTFVAQATDASNPPKNGSATVSVLIRPPLRIVTSTLPDGAVTRPYFNAILAEGGRFPPYKARLTSGALPAGINLNPDSDIDGNFLIGGIPTAAGVSDFTIEVSDTSSPPLTATGSFRIRVNPNLVVNDATLPDVLEGQAFNITFTATGGAPPYTWSGSNLPKGMTLDPSTGQLSGTPAQAFLGSISITVQDSANPPQQGGRFFFWRVIGLLRITTSRLPPIAVGAFFRGFPALTGGTCCVFRWSISAGSLPPGLSLADPVSGEISGTPTATGTFAFTLKVADGGTGAFAQTAEQQLTLVVKASGSLGRNDTIATATPLSNGFYRASISPLADPPTGPTANPDVDVFQLAASPGAVVSVQALIAGISPPSALDPVIEIVDAAGVRLNLCSSLFSNTFGPFDQPCMNDDSGPLSLEAKLLLQVPSSASGPLTFFVRVLDFRGDARPDFLYNLSISGAN